MMIKSLKNQENTMHLKIMITMSLADLAEVSNQASSTTLFKKNLRDKEMTHLFHRMNDMNKLIRLRIGIITVMGLINISKALISMRR
jgi:hypothetical protein